MAYGWSLRKTDWLRLPHDLLTDGKWRFVPLAKIEAVSVPEKSGVYMVCAPPRGRKRPEKHDPNDIFSTLFAPVYVGSGILKQRFTQHASDSPKIHGVQDSRECFGQNLEFWFHQIDSPQMTAVEQSLIDCFGPRGNTIKAQANTIKAVLAQPVTA